MRARTSLFIHYLPDFGVCDDIVGVVFQIPSLLERLPVSLTKIIPQGCFWLVKPAPDSPYDRGFPLQSLPIEWE